jgi:hypothetical protein
MDQSQGARAARERGRRTSSERRRRAKVALALIAFAACTTPKAPLVEPQSEGTFATLIVQCPEVLEEKDREARGAFTTEAALTLAFSGTAAGGNIADPCHRDARPIHLPPGEAQIDARYEERVRPDNTAIEARVACELPRLARDLRAGKSYVYVVAIPKRDASGRFNACSVKIAEVQEAAPAASGDANVTPPQ